MLSTRTKETRCCECEAVIDAATSVEGENVPKKGDVTVCLYCASVMVFADNNGGVRLPNDLEKREIENMPLIAKAQELIRHTDRRNFYGSKTQTK